MSEMGEDRLDDAEAKRIMEGGLGRAELEFVTSICAPMYWIIREADGRVRVRNGTAFFLNTGAEVFGVTAAHVLAGLEEDQRLHVVEVVQLGIDLILELDGRHSIIDRDDDLDIATFHITKEEVARLGKTILSGSQNAWPPVPPKEGKGIYFSGFAAASTLWLSASDISFGATPGSGVADSVGPRDVCTVFNRADWIDVMHLGLPPERYNFGGLSGGPMLAVIERNGIRSWALAGVIVEGPSQHKTGQNMIEGFEMIRARRTHFIGMGGQINREF